MMIPSEEFLRHANECRRMAKSLDDPRDRAYGCEWRSDGSLRELAVATIRIATTQNKLLEVSSRKWALHRSSATRRPFAFIVSARVEMIAVRRRLVILGRHQEAVRAEKIVPPGSRLALCFRRRCPCATRSTFAARGGGSWDVRTHQFVWWTPIGGLQCGSFSAFSLPVRFSCSFAVIPE